MMSSISYRLPDSFSSLVPNRGELANFKRTQFAKTSFQERRSTELTLTTAEGDKVIFSSVSSSHAKHSIYTSQGLVHGVASRTELEAFSVSESFGFEMALEGDLNDQELKDIMKALKTIEKVANDFFAGKTDQVMEGAEKISGLESIASFEAVIQYERSVSLQTASTSVSALPWPETTGQTAQAEATGSVAKTPKQESLLDKITEAILKANVELDKVAKLSNQFLDRLFDQFSQKDDTNALDLLKFREVQSDLLKQLEENESVDQSPTEV